MYVCVWLLVFRYACARVGVQALCLTASVDAYICQCYDILPHNAEHSSGLCSDSNRVRCDKFKNSLHVQDPGLAHQPLLTV